MVCNAEPLVQSLALSLEQVQAAREQAEWAKGIVQSAYDDMCRFREEAAQRAEAAEKERDALRAKYDGIMRSLDAALNSGDGSYRP